MPGSGTMAIASNRALFCALVIVCVIAGSNAQEIPAAIPSAPLFARSLSAGHCPPGYALVSEQIASLYSQDLCSLLPPNGAAYLDKGQVMYGSAKQCMVGGGDAGDSLCYSLDTERPSYPPSYAILYARSVTPGRCPTNYTLVPYELAKRDKTQLQALLVGVREQTAVVTLADRFVFMGNITTSTIASMYETTPHYAFCYQHMPHQISPDDDDMAFIRTYQPYRCPTNYSLVPYDVAVRHITELHNLLGFGEYVAASLADNFVMHSDDGSIVAFQDIAVRNSLCYRRGATSLMASYPPNYNILYLRGAQPNRCPTNYSLVPYELALRDQAYLATLIDSSHVPEPNAVATLEGGFHMFRNRGNVSMGSLYTQGADYSLCWIRKTALAHVPPLSDVEFAKSFEPYRCPANFTLVPYELAAHFVVELMNLLGAGTAASATLANNLVFFADDGSIQAFGAPRYALCYKLNTTVRLPPAYNLLYARSNSPNRCPTNYSLVTYEMAKRDIEDMTALMPRGVGVNAAATLADNFAFLVQSGNASVGAFYQNGAQYSLCYVNKASLPQNPPADQVVFELTNQPRYCSPRYQLVPYELAVPHRVQLQTLMGTQVDIAATLADGFTMHSADGSIQALSRTNAGHSLCYSTRDALTAVSVLAVVPDTVVSVPEAVDAVAP